MLVAISWPFGCTITTFSRDQVRNRPSTTRPSASSHLRDACHGLSKVGVADGVAVGVGIGSGSGGSARSTITAGTTRFAGCVSEGCGRTTRGAGQTCSFAPCSTSRTTLATPRKIPPQKNPDRPSTSPEIAVPATGIPNPTPLRMTETKMPSRPSTVPSADSGSPKNGIQQTTETTTG